MEIAALRETRKVKSLQMFRRPVSEARQGDRVGLCVTQFDAKELERGLVAAAGTLATAHGAIMRLRRIPYFKGEVATKAKFHVSLGHETVLAKLTLFCPEEGGERTDTAAAVSEDARYRFVDKLSDLEDKAEPIFVIMEFERPVVVVPGCKGEWRMEILCYCQDWFLQTWK